LTVGLTRSEAQEKYERIQQCIPLEGAMAWISGHFGPDFSKYDPNEHVQNIEIPGIQGLFDSIIYAKGGAPVTVREAALIYAEGMGMPRLVGTPADIADQLEHFMDERRCRWFYARRYLHTRMFRRIRRSRRTRTATARKAT
jgi:long-chain alkane monooxygenase